MSNDKAFTPPAKPGRGRIYDSITQTIGDTPIVRLDRLAKQKGAKANLLAKLESRFEGLTQRFEHYRRAGYGSMDLRARGVGLPAETGGLYDLDTVVDPCRGERDA